MLVYAKDYALKLPSHPVTSSLLTHGNYLVTHTVLATSTLGGNSILLVDHPKITLFKPYITTAFFFEFSASFCFKLLLVMEEIRLSLKTMINSLDVSRRLTS